MTYDVFAIRYATSIRPSSDYFLGEDPHNGPHPIFYYIWVIRNSDRVIVVDTGFDASRARVRGRDFINCPTNGLKKLGIDAQTVDTVIITHLHYDHAGNLDKFPSARFVLQEDEMHYATGRSMRFKMLQAPFELEDVQTILASNYSGRVRFVDGDAEVAPGVNVHHVPGHSRGLQSVTVDTARGRICLASDAAHFFDNVRCCSPFPITVDVALALEGHEKTLALAGAPERLIPGHDPIVSDLYPHFEGDQNILIVSEDPMGQIPL